MSYQSKYTGAEVDALLDKISEDNVGDIDSSLSTESENPVQNKVVTEELNKKANTTGRYPDLSVGFADDLVGRGESAPAEFSFRASGGKSIKDGTTWIKELRGNSVVWNQVLRRVQYTESGISCDWNDYIVSINGTSTSTYINITPYRIPCHLNEKFIVVAEQIANPNDISFSVGLFNSTNDRAVLGGGSNFSAIIANCIYMSTGSGFGLDRFGGEGTDLTGIQFKVRITSLTKMFGAGNEPTTIEEFNARKPIVEDEYAYNEGEVIHMTAEGIKSVGDNAWDEEWESGHIDYNTGVNISNSGKLKTKGYIRVLPNEEYHLSLPTASYSSDLVVICYDENKAFIQHIRGGSANKTFRIPTNCHYIRFTWDGTQYANNIMLTLVHSGWKQDTDAGYQPYWQDILPLPVIRKYFPDGMKSAGTPHDEIRYNKASGKWEYSKGKIKSVDLGTLNWIKAWYTEEERYRLYCDFPSKAIGRDNIICGRYVTQYITKTEGDMGIDGNPVNTMIYIKDTSFATQGADALIASLQGVILYYESNDWEWVELDEADQNFRDYYKVADFGTEEIIAEQPSAPISADIIYQFNAVDMIREHEIEINELQSIIATMQAQLASLTSNE